jgi:hypothetical protein
MSVARKIIFCEGRQNSLDYRLLSRIVTNISGDECTIVPAGSKFTFSIFAQGYFFPDEVANQKHIIFRDRDFDVKPTSRIQLLQLGNRLGGQSVALTHRSCIENYLLDANLIHDYWKTKYREKIENPTSRWGYGDSPGLEIIAAWIDASAKNLQFYQAVRWALGDLLSISAAREQLKTTWTGNSGKLPESLELQYCHNQALDLINEFKCGVEVITPENFENSVAIYLEKFDTEEFWTQREYLIWFHGKDIQKEMHKQQQNYPPLKKKGGDDFFEWAIDHLDITQNPDFMELRSKIEQL